MAITRVQGNARGTTTSNSISVTMGSAPTSGNVVIAAIGIYASSLLDVNSITQTGVTWSQVVTGASGAARCSIWIGIVGSDAGTGITVNLSGTANGGAVCDVCEYSGIPTTNYLDKTATASGVGASTSTGTTGTTTQADELWIGAISAFFGQSSPTNGFTLLDGAKTDISVAFLEKIVSATGTANSGTTQAGDGFYRGCIATFKAAGITEISSFLRSIFNLSGFLSKLFSFKYNIIGVITRIFSTIYNLGLVISKLLEASYKLSQTLYKMLSLVYYLRQLLSIKFRIIYLLRGKISNLIIIWFSLKSLIARIIGGIYNLKILVSKILKSIFKILSIISKSLVFIFSLKELINKIFKFLNRISSIILSTFVSIFLTRNLREKIIEIKYGTKISIIRLLSSRFGIIGIIQRLLSSLYSFLGFSITSVSTNIPRVIRTGENFVQLRCDWHDETDLSSSDYSCIFWVRDESNNIYGPFTGSITKEGSKEYYAIFNLDPDEGFLLGYYDIKAEVTKYG